MTRVAFVDQTAKMGGAEWSLLDIVRERRKSFDDRVVLFEDGDFADRLRDQSIAVHVCPSVGSSSIVKRNTGWLQQILSLSSVWRQASNLATAVAGMDVIYANTMKAFVVSAVTSRRTGIPLVFHLRDILSSAHFSRVNRGIVQTICRLVNVTVIANSRATAIAYHELVGENAVVRVLYNGIDTEPFDRAFARRETIASELRLSLDIGEGETVIGIFGRLAQWKGQHIAIEAIVDRPNWHLLVVGKAMFGEDDYADQLRQMVIEKGLNDRVHFLGFRADVAETMQGCDVVLHASIDPEPFGRVIAEAMLSRRSVVAARAGGVVEIIDHGRTGWLVTPGDVAATRESIDLALRETDAEMIGNASEFARHQFNLVDRTTDINDVIQGVVELQKE